MNNYQFLRKDSTTSSYETVYDVQMLSAWGDRTV
jgi:hypothetical protein